MAVAAVRKALQDSNVPNKLSDGDVSEAVASLRSRLNRAKASSIGEAVESFSQALGPLVHLLIDKAEVDALDADQWGDLLWDLVDACTVGKSSASKVELFATAPDSWADMTTLVLASMHSGEVVQVCSAWWSKLAVCCYLLLMAFACFQVSTLEGMLSGRVRLLLVLFGTGLLIGIEVWRRKGWHLFVKTVPSRRVQFTTSPASRQDEISLASASSRLRKENDELRADLELLRTRGQRAQGSPAGTIQYDEAGAPLLPEGVPAIPPLDREGPPLKKAVLMKSLEELAQKHGAGDMYVDDSPQEPQLEQIEPEMEVQKGTLVRLKNFVRNDSLNGKLAFVKDTVLASSGLHLQLVRGGAMRGVMPNFWTDKNVQLSLEEESDVLKALGIDEEDSSVPPPAPGLTALSSKEPAEGVSQYAPLSASHHEKVKVEAKHIREMLTRWHSRSTLLATWYRGFWQEVHTLPSLTPVVGSLLASHGYRDAGQGTQPRFEELKKSLSDLESAAAPATGTNKAMFDESGEWLYAEEVAAWTDQIPASWKRSAPETYRNILSSARSVREYVNGFFPMERRDGNKEYLELYNIATSVDFMVRDCKTVMDLARTLTESDIAEIGLCRLESWVYERRTGDKAGAMSMLAVKPPGVLVDIAPQWRISDASTYSQAEHKTRERVRSQNSGSGSSGGYKGRGKGKKGKARGAKAPPG